MRAALSIAGSDSSGGAGIQADIKTMTVHDVYAMTVITALTAQNTTGVYAIQAADPSMVAAQLDCVFTDIPPDSVKIGMLSDAKIIEIVADKLIQYGAKNIVLDPVMIATSGGKLLEPDATDALISLLFPLAVITTPNIPEAESLSGVTITNASDMADAAVVLSQKQSGAVLIKGGHLDEPGASDDLLYMDGMTIWIRGDRISNPNTHGTGCTLSSAIACNLANGAGIEESVRRAKTYVTGAIRAGLDLGRGAGPLYHFYGLR